MKLTEAKGSNVVAGTAAPPGSGLVESREAAPSSLKGHRLDDPMASLLSAPMKPSDVLDLTAVYAYDSLAV